MGFATPRLTVGEASADVSTDDALRETMVSSIGCGLPFDRHVDQVFDAAVVKDFFLGGFLVEHTIEGHPSAVLMSVDLCHRCMSVQVNVREEKKDVR